MQTAISLPRIDIFALLILAGAVQGFFLSLIFLKKGHRNNQANTYLGLLLLVLTLCTFEIFLNYSGLMFRILWLDNFSEPTIFLLGPLMFLYVSSVLNIHPKKPWIHFVWFGFYACYHVIYLIQPLDFKFNSVNQMYAFGLPMKPWVLRGDPDPLRLRLYVNQLLAIHWAAYIIAASVYIVKAYRKEGISIFSFQRTKFRWLRNIHFHLWVSFLIFIVVKITFGRDLGDYLVASYMAAIMYIISFDVATKSIFFKAETSSSAEVPKYQKSPLTEEDKDLIKAKVDQCMKVEKCFMNNLFSLNDLAKKVGVPPHHLSQVINEMTNKTFFEYIAEYRINEAKELLSGTGSFSLTIEEVAEQVGYNSKSAFNKTFKKLTGQTPSEYREKAKK